MVVGGALPLVHEQHVDVGRVRQLARAEAAHADHRERERRAERCQCGLERRLRQHRQLALGRFEPRVPEEVTGRDPEQLASLEAPEPFTTLLLVAPPLERVEGVGDEVGARALDREGLVVVEGVDELRVPPQGLADDPAGAQEVARALGRPGRVAEGHRQGGRSRRSLDQSPQLEEPEVGVGCLRQPLEDDGEHLAHDAGAPREPVGELPHRRSRALDVGEAERGEAFLGRLGRERAGAREGLEERSEEQTLVDAPDRALVLPVLRFEALERGPFGAVAVPEHPRQADARVLVGRDHVRLLLVVELDAVLDRPEEPVRAVESVGVGTVDVAAGRELVQRVERRR